MTGSLVSKTSVLICSIMEAASLFIFMQTEKIIQTTLDTQLKSVITNEEKTSHHGKFCKEGTTKMSF